MVEERTLVGLIRSPGDLHRFREEQWYRIPQDTAITLDNSWPPQWVAAFESVSSSGSRQQVRYYGRVERIESRSREELFPGMPAGDRAGKMYHKLLFSEIQALENPLVPARPRRQPFIQTTLRKLVAAQQFNDLFNASSYEDDLWAAFKESGIDAEREWPVQTSEGRYSLDFALFCRTRKIDVEVDGRPHHSVEANSIKDAARDRALGSRGWAIVRFRTQEIHRRLAFCLQRISDTIQTHGGLEGFGAFLPDGKNQATQMALLEERFSYDDGESD